MPDHRESLAGYLWRLSEANGYTGVERMRGVFNHAGVLWRMMLRPYDDDTYKVLPVLQDMTGLNQQVFLDTCLADIPGKCEAAHHVNAPFLDWRTGFTRICPDCLAEQGVMFKQWDMLPYSVCDIHRRRLIHQCPACETPIKLHADLHLHCHKCETSWAHSCKANEDVPEYQAAWQRADDQEGWLREFGWMILRAARPMDFQHCRVKYYNAPVDSLEPLLMSAWNLMTDGEQRRNWEASRAFRFAHLSGLKVKKSHVKPGLPAGFNVLRNRVADNELMPTWATAKYSPEMISWTFNTENLIDFIGLSKIVTSLPSYDREYFQHILRTEAREIIERLGFEPLKHEYKINNQRFDIRSVNEWIEQIPLYESLESAPELIWIEANDPILRIHGADIIVLANCIRYGEVEGYRRLHNGIGTLGLRQSDLDQWLLSHLTELCRTPVVTFTVSSMTGLGKGALTQLSKKGILRREPGKELCTYLNGDDVKNYILENKSKLLDTFRTN
jgi:hypothetical protein